MIAVDTNILVYAHRRDSDFFSAASAALRRLAEGPEFWAIPWPCVHEFLAVVTNPRIFRVPTPLTAAIAQVELWRESPTLRLVGETPEYWPALTKLLTQGKIAGAKVHDARIAAVCVAQGIAELWSADRDFTRIEGVRITNPILASVR